MQDLLGMCTRYVPFLAQSCTILHQFLQDLAKKCKLTGSYSCSISCKILHHFLQESCKIVQELCKIVQEKGHNACTCQASLACKILARFLHDLASSFLLGMASASSPSNNGLAFTKNQFESYSKWSHNIQFSILTSFKVVVYPSYNDIHDIFLSEISSQRSRH